MKTTMIYQGIPQSFPVTLHDSCGQPSQETKWDFTNTNGDIMWYLLVIFNFAIENCPFIVDLPIKDGYFP